MALLADGMIGDDAMPCVPGGSCSRKLDRISLLCETNSILPWVLSEEATEPFARV